MYEQQQVIISTALPASADTLIQYYETTNFSDSRHINESNESNEIDDQSTVALYWLFLDSIKPVWAEASWITAFNHSHQQSLPVIISGIKSWVVSALAQNLQCAWVYYVPFVFLQDGDAYSSMLNPSL